MLASALLQTQSSLVLEMRQRILFCLSVTLCCEPFQIDEVTVRVFAADALDLHIVYDPVQS